ncbi:MAG TPA: FAD-dependent monooxygenase [Planctomycetota bacterium]|nr:FAD-dependent monooxygenase [Planctomycetota bacterium]
MLDVLVCGAGPVGLAMGVQLARFGLSFRIVEKNKEPTPLNESRALGVHARTLEVFEDMGVLAAAEDAGMRWHGLNAFAGGKRILHVSFDETDAAHPFLLSLSQSRTERILEARLGELGAKVERGRELLSFEQDETRVRAKVGDETIEARWIVGTDGAHSVVRHGLGIEFEGAPYEERFVLTDLTIDGDYEPDESCAWFSPEGMLILLPLKGDKKARLLAQVQGDPAPTLALFEELLAKRAPGARLRLRDPVWLASFKIHHRLAARYRVGRGFIAGDAAHIHSPVGGQGMNTGIQDVYNLAWKLALAAKGGKDLLASYEVERRPVAQAVVRGTDLATRAVLLRHPVAQEIRNAVYKYLGQLEVVQQRILRAASELDIHYRKSPICGGSAPLFASGPSPGDRAPDDIIDGGRRFFDVRSGTEHTLLAVDCPAPELRGVRVVKTKAAHRYGQGLYLVRPDGYVGYRTGDERALGDYVSGVLGL